jgi:hypothetical protein
MVERRLSKFCTIPGMNQSTATPTAAEHTFAMPSEMIAYAKDAVPYWIV